MPRLTREHFVWEWGQGVGVAPRAPVGARREAPVARKVRIGIDRQGIRPLSAGAHTDAPKVGVMSTVMQGNVPAPSRESARKEVRAEQLLLLDLGLVLCQ